MKVSCGEGVASHVGPESCGDHRKVVSEALTGESAGRVLSLDSCSSGTVECRRGPYARKATADVPLSQGTAVLRDPCGGRRATAVPTATQISHICPYPLSVLSPFLFRDCGRSKRPTRHR